MMPEMVIYGNKKMDAALTRYEDHFGTLDDLVIYGLAIDSETASTFEAIINRAIKNNRRVTESELTALYEDVPPPGGSVAY